MSVLQTFTVTVANPGSGNKYYIDGVLQDTVNLIEGATYRFDQSDSSNSTHPLRFSTTSDGTHGGGSEYTTGVTVVGTPGSSGAYTEISVASSAPTLYYYCTNHSGMGGQANTVLSETWGVLSWNSGAWASQGNSTIDVTGFDLSVSEGNVDTAISIGWGAQFWGAGEWGELSSPEVPLTGIEITPSVGSSIGRGGATVTPSGIQVSGSTGQLSYIATYEVSGIAATTTLGNEFAGELNKVPVTSPSNDEWGLEAWGNGQWGLGDGISLSLGSPTISGEATVSPTGVNLTPTVASIVAGASALVLPTGVEASSSLGNEFAGELVEVPVTSPVNDEWGTEPWGQGFWGVGDGVTIFTGTPDLSITADVPLTGVELSSSLGQVEQNTIYDVTAVTATTALNDVFGGPLVQVSVTTASTQPWGEIAWGDGQWGQSVGTDISQGGEEVVVPSIDVEVTGLGLSSNTGDEAVTGDCNLSLTGIGLDIQQGDEDAFTNVRINVSGNNIGTIVIGDYQAGISDTALPTGVTITPSTGIISTNAWAVVDPGSSPTWTVVDKAA